MNLASLSAWLLFLVGMAALLITYLPFSPMTIDIVNFRRETQLNIFRHRKIYWLVGVACLCGVSLLGLSGLAADAWFWVALVSAAIMLFLYWSGYVPWVMTAPHDARVINVFEASEILNDDDAVLGLFHDGEARAYPRDLIARPHFLPDTIASTPVTVSYCILCNSGVAFVSELNSNRLELDCVTAYNNNIIYRDKRSGNIIQQLDGRVIEGPDKGAELRSLPVTVMNWKQWRELHPDTKVCYAPAKSIRDKMVAWMLELLIPIAKLSKRTKPWHRVRGEIDLRLPAMSYVFGVEIGSERCAYPEAFLTENPVHDDIIGGQPIVTLFSPKGAYGGVFSRELEGEVLSFRHEVAASGTSMIIDCETRSEWNLAGLATDGVMKGKMLNPVTHFNKVFWFSWSLFKPGTRIVSDAQPKQGVAPAVAAAS